MATVHYNNNIFAFRGRISRTAYIVQNFIINIIGFRFIYYPGLVEGYKTLIQHPETREFISVLYRYPLYSSIFDHFASAAVDPTYIYIIGYLFIIPLRMIDIKRVRDIINDEISTLKTIVLFIVLSLPLVDLIATIVLAVVPANRYAKRGLQDDVKQQDINEAKVEYDLAMYKRLFEDGKISKSEYLQAIEKNKKLN